MQLPDARYHDQAVELLGDLIRIDTTNPPGNEVECARYLQALLSPAGIETEVIESAPGRGNLIARWRGQGEGRPLLLMAHLDVVAAAAEDWTVPPFEGIVRDGYLWGRGATDIKNMVAVCAQIMLALTSLPQRPRRDVLFMATADEEHGGTLGMGWLTKHRPELFDVECAINEGGGGAVKVNGRVSYTCQVAEKGLCRTVWTARGKAGHGSSPRLDVAPLKLSRALMQLEDGYLGGRATVTMRAALRALAAQQSPHSAERVEALLDQRRFEDALAAAGFDGHEVQTQRPLFYDTACPTGLRAGDPRQINVIPSMAQAYVDGRILPGQTTDGFVAMLQERAGDGAQVEVYDGQATPGLEASSDTPIFQTITRVIAECCDGAAVLPWLCPGSTDAKHLAPIGVPVYGFVPSQPLPEGVEENGAHAVDERIWLDNLRFSLRVLYDIVYRFCMEGGQ